MKTYTENDVLRLAKRVNNTKRTFLLVNPLQGKHLPVRPADALDMMHALGAQLREKYPRARLVVGFAETATAIGAAVASCFGEGVRYIHTTREQLAADSDWILFLEEHSHAMEQKLHRDGLMAGLQATPTVIFVEDELSTGRTLLNMIAQLRRDCPGAAGVQMVAASVINRLSEENLQKLTEAGVACEYLVKLPEVDYTAALEGVEAAPAVKLEPAAAADYTVLDMPAGYPNPRLGVDMAAYDAYCHEAAESVAVQLAEAVKPENRVLVLGTEECMYPALVTGRVLAEMLGCSVVSHATTRSPIGVCTAEGYPIRSGYALRSFYEAETRATYLYALAAYDAVLVVTDTPEDAASAMAALTRALQEYGSPRMYIAGCE